MKNSSNDIKQQKTALYIRLSREDGDKEESNSIVHQRSILHRYIEEHLEFCIYDEYVDDGFSGTNFKRPGFERMMNDIQKGHVQVVLVKDLSRFARDYVMAGWYIERTFPELGVRFIAIGENYDSDHAEEGASDLLLPIQNLFNEFHARDTSKKVQKVMHSMQKEGLCVAAFVPYGYKKNPQDKHYLIVDDYAAFVVRRIFDMYLSGMGMLTISKQLNKEGILCPTLYKRENGSNFVSHNRLETTSYWTETTVKSILKNEVYIGTLVQGKTIRCLNRKRKRVPEEEWIRVPNMHEPIVSKEKFEKAQILLKRNARSMKLDGLWSIFAGVIKCGDCGRSLVKTAWKETITYKCGTYKRIGSNFCTSHAIKESVLCNILREDLNQIITQVENLTALIEEQKPLQTSNNIDNQRRKIQLNLDKCMRQKAEAYDDYKEGLLSKDEFIAYGKKCDVKKTQYEKQLEVLEEEKEKEQKIQNNPWIQKLLTLRRVDVIDRETVLDMVHEIKIFEDNKIVITYNFSEEFDFLFQDYIETIN